jgi:hypothetical protein
VYQPIATLPGSALHRTAVAIYQRHQAADGDKYCPACGRPAPCPARRHASAVIAAANENPGWYDGRLSGSESLAEDPRWPSRGERPGQPFVAFARGWPPVQLPLNPPPSTDNPGEGWFVGNVGQRVDVPVFQHER